MRITDLTSSIRQSFGSLALVGPLALLAPPMVQGQEGNQPSIPEVPTLPETEVTAEPEEDDEPDFQPPFDEPFDQGPFQSSLLEDSIFRSPQADGYRASSSTTGSIVNIPDLSLPATVSVVTQDTIRDQQAIQFKDILRDIGGAVSASGGDGAVRPDTFILRGYEVQSTNFRKNGFLDPTFTPRDFVNVERVEVLKGPAAALYGAGQPAGTVNLITKLPQDINFTTGAVQFGSYGLDRYTFDSTGRVNDDGSLLYRITGAYTNTGTFRDFGFFERTFVSPSLTYVLNDDASITWQGEYSFDRRMFDTGVATNNNNPRQFAIDTFFGEPANDFQHFHDYRQSLFYNHKLGDCWTLYAGGYSLFYDAPSSGTIPTNPSVFSGVIPPPTPTSFARTRQNTDPFAESYHSAIINLAGEFDAFGVHHNMLFGTEQGWQISNDFQSRRSFTTDPLGPTFVGLGFITPVEAAFVDTLNSLYIDGNNPVDNNPAFGATDPFINFQFNTVFRQNRHGFYMQDLVELNEYWKVMAGVRFDHVTTHLQSSQTIFSRYVPGPIPLGTSVRDQTNNIVTPRVGVVFSPYPDALSFYATYTRGFNPQGGLVSLVPPGLPIDPTLSDAFEAGVKTNLLDYLTFTCAGYYTNQSNDLALAFDQNGNPIALPGDLRSQGMEMNLIGQITRRWSVIYNWTYSDTRWSSPGTVLDGQRNRNVPLNNSNIWTRYNLLQDCCQTFGVALGMVQVGSRLGDFNSPLRLPAYDRWDAGMYYHRGRVDVGVYLENIFNTEYYAGSFNQFQIAPGAPTNVRAQVGVVF
jgi:outer membrane receptor protein involved in Fe transport